MAKSVNAAHILVNSEKDAQNILARLEKGESFEALAKRFSKCPSKSKGGNLGWFGKGDMVPEFENAAFNAKKGEVVGPVKTEFGYHLILVKDLK
jgi:peptidyl-prolyl cis-trans isomerase C